LCKRKGSSYEKGVHNSGFSVPYWPLGAALAQRETLKNQSAKHHHQSAVASQGGFHAIREPGKKKKPKMKSADVGPIPIHLTRQSL